ncbi:YGGT family-domain-containing protein [Tribonema minus]|uniref:YGGT family-domain-containing protein n=1 Tax=Tribonema minus TaxID=303371 RepID=A0A835ZBV2_9STRA|nr:YGGT family-domain-containing protein [Tribonema minus]
MFQQRPHLYSQQRHVCAAVIPGDSLVEETVIGGTINFLRRVLIEVEVPLYNFVITARVLLSWFPQAQGMSFLRPVYTVTDPYLNTFRRLPLQFGGIDFSILPAFFLLSVAQSAIASLGAEVPKLRAQQARMMAELRAKSEALANGRRQ